MVNFYITSSISKLLIQYMCEHYPLEYEIQETLGYNICAWVQSLSLPLQHINYLSAREMRLLVSIPVYILRNLVNFYKLSLREVVESENTLLSINNLFISLYEYICTNITEEEYRKNLKKLLECLTEMSEDQYKGFVFVESTVIITEETIKQRQYQHHINNYNRDRNHWVMVHKNRPDELNKALYKLDMQYARVLNKDSTAIRHKYQHNTDSIPIMMNATYMLDLLLMVIGGIMAGYYLSWARGYSFNFCCIVASIGGVFMLLLDFCVIYTKEIKYSVNSLAGNDRHLVSI